MTEWFRTRQLDDGVLALEEPHVDAVASFLVEGEKKALLIDTGLGIGDIRAAAEALTAQPIEVVNTHAHYDHVGGNHLFEAIAVHAEEVEAVEASVTPEKVAWIADPSSFLAPAPEGFRREGFHIKPARVTGILEDGDRVDLGGRSLRILHTPGHSPGSISLWEEAKGILFAGDLIYYGNLFVCLPGSDFSAYLDSIKRLVELVEAVRLLLPSHGQIPLPSSALQELLRWLEQVKQGRIAWRQADLPWTRARVFAGRKYNLLLTD